MNKENHKNKIIVRYPPSPTGNLHIGNIRTMLFNYLFAKHAEVNGGDSEIYMRFEDTDRERSDVKYEDIALNTLEALGIHFDHGPYRQSERGGMYTKAIAQLIEQGNAYEGEESKDGSGDKVIRFKNPNKKITFIDKIRGDITIDTTDFGDFVIARSLENPLYHLTVVVDDIDMMVTHVIRGEDHITSTPRQILLIEALGGTIPTYAHLPMIVGADKKKLSKRHGAVTYQEFEKLGYLPEAIINYLAMLGWSDGNDRELYTMQELIDAFTLENVSKSPAMFSYEKLNSVNRHYILQMSDEDFKNSIIKYLTGDVKNFLTTSSTEVNEAIIHTIIKERINKWSDVTEICNTDLSWLSSVGNINIEKVIWKKSTKEETKKHLNLVIELLSKVSESDWATASYSKSNENTIKNAIWDYASEAGRGDVLWPLRYSLTGAERSPDPFITAFILGKKETIKRLTDILKKI